MEQSSSKVTKKKIVEYWKVIQKNSKEKPLFAPFILGTVIMLVTLFGLYGYEAALNKVKTNSDPNSTIISITPTDQPATPSATPSSNSQKTTLPSSNPTTSNTKPTPTSTPNPKKASIVITGVTPLPASGGTVSNVNECIKVQYTKTPSTGAVYLQFKVDSNNWSGYYPYYEPCMLVGLSLGQHSISVQLKDSDGNESAVETRSFTIIDNDPPTFVSLSGPAEGSTTSPPFCFPTYFTDNVSKNLKLSYKLDSADWTSWAADSAPCFQTMASGPHTFQVKMRDDNNNESQVIIRNFSVQ